MKITNIKIKEQGEYLRLNIKCPDCEYLNTLKVMKMNRDQEKGTDAEVKCVGCGAIMTYDWEK